MACNVFIPERKVMTFTVWSYDYDAAPHHANELAADTHASEADAITRARLRTAQTAQNTGWAKVVDNSKVGRSGNGVVCTFSKTVRGVVRIRR